MAGTLIVSNLTTDTDNTFIVRSNTGTTLFSANTTGIDVANSIGATAITNDKILSVANTKISGLVTASQIANVANTQLTGTLIASQIASVNATTATSGTLPTARLPSGTVLQVVSANTTTSTSTSSTSFVATNLAATITPISTSSKIFIIVAGGAIRAGSGNQIYMTVYRGATNLGNANRGLSQMNGNASNDYTPALSYYDGPATTSPTTYTVYVATSSSTVNFEVDTVPCTMTLMEIAG